MPGWFTLDATELDRLQKIMDEYGDIGTRTINNVLHGEGAEIIQNKIHNLLPVSGRTWRRKKASARTAQPFTKEDGMLSVTTVSRGAYHYLYFPDDGSNTKRHVGNQQFMMRGAKDAASDIIDLCLGKLTEKF